MYKVKKEELDFAANFKFKVPHENPSDRHRRRQENKRVLVTGLTSWFSVEFERHTFKQILNTDPLSSRDYYDNHWMQVSFYFEQVFAVFPGEQFSGKLLCQQMTKDENNTDSRKLNIKIGLDKD